MKPTVGDQQFLSRLGHIAHGLIGFNISDDGAYRHPDIQVFTAFTGTIPTLAVFTAFSLEYPGMTEIDQGVQVGVAYQINTAAITAITTVRPAKGDKLLAAKTGTAVTAIAPLHLESHLIDEFHNCR